MLKNSEKLGQNSIPPRDKDAFRASEIATVDLWNSVSHSGVLFDRPAKTTSNGRRGLLAKEKQSADSKGQGLGKAKSTDITPRSQEKSYAKELIKE